MWVLAEEIFLTCVKRREFRVIRDLVIGGFKPVMILESKFSNKQRPLIAFFLKDGVWAKCFLAYRLDFDSELGGLVSKLLIDVLPIWKCWEVGGWFVSPIN